MLKIQELEINGLLITNKQDIADTLNTYFSQIGSDIVQEVENDKNIYKYELNIK